MAPTILLVNDQRDILRLLHSALDTLQRPELEIIEAPSDQEALLEFGRRRIELLVVDYHLPGMTGLELMHRVRAHQPDVHVILITGRPERKTREELLNAGAAAIFEKPIPLGDFLGSVERILGPDSSGRPDETEPRAETRQARFSDLLTNFRQDMDADAVFLLNDHGLVVARAGDLPDRSMEVSLISALAATASAGIKVAKSAGLERLEQYSVFAGGDHDLILMPVDVAYSLVVAGAGLAAKDRLADTVQAMSAVRNELGRALRSIGATGPLPQMPRDDAPKSKRKAVEPATTIEAEIQTLMDDAKAQGIDQDEVNAFWDKAAEEHAGKSSRPEAIPYEEARKRGLIPHEE